MLRRFMRDKYCAENKIGAFNQAVLNDYSLWLETKLHESTSNNAEATALLLDSVSKQQYVEVLSKLDKATELINHTKEQLRMSNSGKCSLGVTCCCIQCTKSGILKQLTSFSEQK